MKKRDALLLIGFGLILMFVLKSCGSSKGKDADSVSSTEVNPTTIVVPAKDASPSGTADLILSGVILDPGAEPLALINGNIHKKGDKVGDYKIQGIHPNEVIVANGKQRLILKLFHVVE